MKASLWFGVVGLSAGSVLTTDAAHSADTQRQYNATRYALQIGANTAGWVSSVSDMQGAADVIETSRGGPRIKATGIVSYDTILLKTGVAMSKDFFDWLKASFAHIHARKDGAIIGADFNGKELERRTFFNALVSEVDFPALDASGKDALSMTIKLAPESVRDTRGAGAAVQTPQDAKQKKWLPSNFKLFIQGIDAAATTHVSKVGAIVFKQAVVTDPNGGVRDYADDPAYQAAIPFSFTIPQADAQRFDEWAASTAQRPNNHANTRVGSVVYLGDDLRTTLFTVTLTGLRLARITPEKVEAGSDNVKRVSVELSAVGLQLDY